MESVKHIIEFIYHRYSEETIGIDSRNDPENNIDFFWLRFYYEKPREAKAFVENHPFRVEVGDKPKRLYFWCDDQMNLMPSKANIFLYFVPIAETLFTFDMRRLATFIPLCKSIDLMVSKPEIKPVHTIQEKFKLYSFDIEEFTQGSETINMSETRVM
jgi:hypothetical protein